MPPFRVMERSPISAGDRVLVLVCLVMAGTILLALGRFPTLQRELTVLGTPLGLSLNGRGVLGVLLVALTAAGTDTIVRAVDGRAHIDLRYTVTFWILPCLVTIAAATASARLFDTPSAWLLSLVLLGGLLALVVDAEHRTIDLDGPFYRRARLGLNIATYGAALALYATIYGLQVRSLVSAPLVMLVTFPLALELLRSTEEAYRQSWLHAAVVALILGELTWALNAWGLSAMAGGGLLLIAFYCLSGLAQQHLAGRLRRRVLIEYLSTAFIGIVVIWISSPWL